MAKPGRRTKYTPDRVEKILSLLRAGNTRKASSEASGIDQDTLLRWIHRYTDFAESVRIAESEAEAAYVKTLETAASKGSVPAAIFWLERRRHSEWARRDRLEVVQSVKQMATSSGVDEDAAVKQAEQILKELRSAQRG